MKISYIRDHKQLIRQWSVIATDGSTIYVVKLYGPKVFRTGMEQVIAVAWTSDDREPSIGYAGGRGYDKHAAAVSYAVSEHYDQDVVRLCELGRIREALETAFPESLVIVEANA